MILLEGKDIPADLLEFFEPVQINAKGDVFSISTKPYSGAHFATFPPALVEPCILAGTSERGACPVCGKAWVRVVEKPDMSQRPTRATDAKMSTDEIHISNNWAGYPKSAGQAYQEWRNANPNITTGWRPTCDHYNERYRSDFPKARRARKRQHRDLSGDWWKRVRRRGGLDHWPVEPCSVLDPFGGSGTTALVARQHGRHATLIEKSAEYVELARRRLAGTELVEIHDPASDNGDTVEAEQGVLW